MCSDITMAVVIVGGILLGLKMIVIGWMREVDKNQEGKRNGNN